MSNDAQPNRVRSHTLLDPSRALVLLGLAVALAGCSSTTLKLYVRPNTAAPTLAGKTVAVVPPITFGGDVVNAVIFDRATSRVFRDRLGEVSFIAPDAVRGFVGEVPGATTALATWSQRAEKRSYFPAEGDTWILHDRKKPLPGGVQLEQIVEFRSGGGATTNLLPSQIDPSWFGRLEADYLLMSMSYTKYRHESAIYALFGIIPFGGYSYGGPADVRAHYAIYDRRTGQRLWEAYFGVATNKTSPGKWPDFPLDPRSGTVLGAAWALCQDFQAAALRLISNDPRRSDDLAN